MRTLSSSPLKFFKHKDKIESYQTKKDKHDRRTLERHIDFLEGTPDTTLDLAVYHHTEITRITDEQEDRHLALSLANGSIKETAEDFGSSSIELKPAQEDKKGEFLEAAYTLCGGIRGMEQILRDALVQKPVIPEPTNNEDDNTSYIIMHQGNKISENFT